MEKKSKRYGGGAAIMVKVPPTVPSDLTLISRGLWGHEHEGRLALNPEDYHMTLQFLGRDLRSDIIASAISGAFAFSEDHGPIYLQFTGRFKTLLTRKGRYLALEIEKDELLLEARARLAQCLSDRQVAPKDELDFNPHMTLVELPPGGGRLETPGPVQPFLIECHRLIVKYGSHRMVVDL
jgi:2'-5' RNA ligase